MGGGGFNILSIWPTEGNSNWFVISFNLFYWKLFFQIMFCKFWCKSCEYVPVWCLDIIRTNRRVEVLLQKMGDCFISTQSSCSLVTTQQQNKYTHNQKHSVFAVVKSPLPSTFVCYNISGSRSLHFQTDANWEPYVLVKRAAPPQQKAKQCW